MTTVDRWRKVLKSLAEKHPEKFEFKDHGNDTWTFYLKGVQALIWRSPDGTLCASQDDYDALLGELGMWLNAGREPHGQGWARVWGAFEGFVDVYADEKSNDGKRPAIDKAVLLALERYVEGK